MCSHVMIMDGSKVEQLAAIMVDRWSYCSVCRRNHDEKRKHIFSAHHKEKLAAILSKFSKKVRSARRCLANPSVVDGELEPGDVGKMWCYCCGKEIQKHVSSEEVSIEWGGLLQHMAEQEHHKRTRRFWWENGADSNQMQTFLLHAAEYSRYKELTSEALVALEKKKQERLKELAEDLKVKEEQRMWTALEPPVDQRKSSAITKGKKPAKKVSWSSDAQHKTTNSSNSQVLTRIPVQKVAGVKGNVHTGATPPWLRDDDSEDTETSQTTTAAASLVGPSHEDFILHRERQKRAGRNPNRVGADFHIKLATQKQPDSDDWLPAFGRVWNYGPRLHSKAEFLQELNKQPGVTPDPLDATATSQGRGDGEGRRIGGGVSPRLPEGGLDPQPKAEVTARTGVGSSQSLSVQPRVIASSSSQATSSVPLSSTSDLPSSSLVAKPYRRKRVWDADAQTYVIKS